MTLGLRTTLATFVGLAVWAFFFVPNRTFHMFNVQGLGERIPIVVLFGVIPLALGALLTLILERRTLLTAAVIVGVPLLGVVACLLFWATGYYSPEDLLGAWLNCLPAVPA